MYNRIAHGFAGTLIITSLVLTHFTGNNNWLWIAAFVGVNLFQNSLTNWCLLHQILKAVGIKDENGSCSTNS
ncbi:MAG TPA: DUF2892 domain-containing protein [Chitinophagales bacterium]|nr:DUF2892 domain-containing protein [Chitinophagales bacterium]MCB0514016.1 DUF2892 domain-containing protein [Bacteroidota bacterium]MCB9074147.1 DUF2892 domain-containing protein [Chitinophagales bacterium]HMU98650.1 DUF2892 domain-containing protein [Chitinophagales bacterium]HMV03637.1 DUF2892 domain-containing protein [Chitinophagales bacterium]